LGTEIEKNASNHIAMHESDALKIKSGLDGFGLVSFFEMMDLRQS
jgi:hypothetical protein